MGKPISLMSRICDRRNLDAAWKRVRAKASAGGVDGQTVASLGEQSDQMLDSLCIDLLEERYAPEPLLEFKVAKPGKDAGYRALRLLAVRDKVAQEAVRRVIEPRIDRTFLDFSYGYRPRKGARKAIGRVGHQLDSHGLHWAARADIERFFDAIDRTHLMQRFEALVTERAVCRLVELWLETGVVDRRARWQDVQSGVAQGAVLSPLLANLYLHDLDVHLAECGVSCVRYADDFLLLCSERRKARDALECAQEYLASELSLRVNTDPRPIASYQEGFSFLGVRFEPGRRLVDTARVEGFVYRASKILRDHTGAERVRRWNQSCQGWRQYYGSFVDDEALEVLQGMLADAARRQFSQEMQAQSGDLLATAGGLLAPLEFLRPLMPEEREGMCSSIARESKLARTVATAPRRPRRRRRSKMSRGEAPATVTRRVRRRYAREFASEAELVVDEPGSFVGVSGGRAVVRVNRRAATEVPLDRLRSITVGSRGVSLSSDLVFQCAAQNVPVLFLKPDATVAATVATPAPARGSVAVRQIEAVEQEGPAIELARRFLTGKIANQATLMRYFNKYWRQRNQAFADLFETRMTRIKRALQSFRDLDCTAEGSKVRSRMMGIEGNAAQAYWDLFGTLVPAACDFPGRRHRGAADAVNAALNYGYAVLLARVRLGIAQAGLVPEIGLLHTPRGDAPGLAFDLVEEFRPVAVDRTVLAMLGRREGLRLEGRGRLDQDSRNGLLERLHQRLASLVNHRGRELSLDEVIRGQAVSVAAALNGRGVYRAFRARW